MIYILCRRGREGERKRRRRKSSGSRLLFVHRPGTFFTWFYRLYGTYREMRSRRGFVLQCAALWFLIDLLTQEHCVTLKRGENFLKEKFPWRGNIGLDIPVSTDKLHQDIYKKKKKKNRIKDCIKQKICTRRQDSFFSYFRINYKRKDFFPLILYE